ncbi:MAG TPA: DoxX family protein [Kofleriaceae bacterium]|nr:DoxX family protein [Kofleriaceae bacterium]
MLGHATLAERIAYGRPIDPTEDDSIRVAPRPGIALLGRIAISVIFFVSGFAKLADLSGTAQVMAAAGIPQPASLAFIAGIGEVLGAASIALGLLTRVGALGLLLYLIPTTLIFHGFWSYTGAAQQMQLIELLKNLAIMGGLATLVAYGAGGYSADARVRRPMQP